MTNNTNLCLKNNEKQDMFSNIVNTLAFRTNVKFCFTILSFFVYFVNLAIYQFILKKSCDELLTRTQLLS